MKKITISINIALVLIISLSLVLIKDQKTKYKSISNISTKKINTSILMFNINKEENKKTEEDLKKETIKQKEIIEQNENNKNENINPTNNQKKQEELIEEKKEGIYVGLKIKSNMVAYGTDCCSADESKQGRTSSGYNIKKNGIYYNDPTYNRVRILASDTNFKLYSIIKVIDPKEGTYYAIVLDRADKSIGLNKNYLFDIVVETQEKARLEYGVHKNVEFEVVRIGK